MGIYRMKGLPWSSGIRTDVSDCRTAQEVMDKAGLNWSVDKCEIMAKMPFNLASVSTLDINSGDFAKDGNIYKNLPNAYATYRKDLDIPLGFVKSKYEVVQNVDAFSFFNDAIGENKAIWDTAGFFGHGEKIYVSAKLPVETRVGKDKIDNYLVFSNSHDGSASVDILFSPIRIICTNMLNSALRSSNSHIRLKHTKSIKERLNRGAEILRIACEHAKEAEDLYNALYLIKMKDQDVMKYLVKLVLSDAELQALNEYDKTKGYEKLIYKDYLTLNRTGISTRKANIITSMYEYYHDGFGQRDIAGTAWGAYNAVTGYYANVANLEGERRTDNLLWGSANNNMNKALNDAILFQAA